MFIGSPDSATPGNYDEDLAAETIIAAIESGSTLIDTALIYGSTGSERIIGRVLASRPDLADRATVVTKVGSVPGERDYSYDAVMRHVEGSQERLRLDTFALLSIHDAMDYPMDQVMADNGALGALRKLQDEETVRYIGTGMNDPHTTEPYIETGEFDVCVVPNAWSLLNRLGAERILPAAEKHDVGILLAQPLERGLLAVGASSGIEFHRRSFSEACLAHVTEIEAICAHHSIPLLALALQYELLHPRVSAVIPGARTPEEAVQNARASEVEIPEALWEELLPILRHWELGVDR